MISQSKQEKYLAAIAATSAEDYAGSTSFAQLTPSQRLDWLAETAQTVMQLKGLANKDIRNKREVIKEL